MHITKCIKIIHVAQLLSTRSVAVSCGYDTWFAVRLVMDYTASHFTWSLDYTQKLTKSTLAVKLSVSAIIYPWWTATACLSVHFCVFAFRLLLFQPLDHISTVKYSSSGIIFPLCNWALFLLVHVLLSWQKLVCGCFYSPKVLQFG